MEEMGAVKVLRFNPAKDREPYFEVFNDVPYSGRSILDVLLYLYEERDNSLAFRHSCRAALCSACTLKVNGKNVLACKTLSSKEMTIEPLPSFALIKDLVFDLAARA